VAYLICEFDYDETAFPSGLPNVSAIIRGAKLYDPRTATTVWSENPALMVRHVLTHPQFGKRTSMTAAEDARITAAANACDASTVYTVDGVAQTARALYTRRHRAARSAARPVMRWTTWRRPWAGSGPIRAESFTCAPAATPPAC
jgi:hypothetical protein